MGRVLRGSSGERSGGQMARGQCSAYHSSSEPFSLKIKRFIYFEKERERVEARGGTEGGRGRENLKQAPAQLRARSHEPQDHDLSQNQELDVSPTEPPRQPPGIYVFESFVDTSSF